MQTYYCAQRGVKKVGLLLATLAAVLAGSLFIISGSAFATDNSANSLKISPLRTDIEITPGGSKIVKVTVTNLTNAPIAVTPVENDFVAGDEKGTPALILDANKYAPSHSLKRFMVPLSNVTIPAKQSKEVAVTINVPKDAQPGGYFGALRFEPTALGSGGQVNLSLSSASIILLTVPGEVVQHLNLTNFDIQQSGKTNSFFTTPKDLSVLARFENTGGIQLAPFGKVSVTQGDKVVYSTDFNQTTPKQMTLPGYARRWTIPIEKVGEFGYYTVSATFTYGSKNQTIDVKTSFWVIPVWMMIAAAALLVVIIIAIIVTIYALKKRNNRRGLSGQRRRR